MYESLIVFFCLITNSLCLECPNGWTRLEAHCYFYIDRLMSYEEANTQCKSFGAQLVAIKSQFQNQMVTDLLHNTWAKNVNIWLGARKLISTDHYNQWVWNDFSEVYYFNWAPKQPNSNGAQYCVQMVRRFKVNYDWPAGTWNDISCKENNTVLCQQKAGDSWSSKTVTKHEYLRNEHQPVQLKADNIPLIIGIIIICSVIISALVSCSAYLMINYYFNIHFKFESPRTNFGFRLIRDDQSLSSGTLET